MLQYFTISSLRHSLSTFLSEHAPASLLPCSAQTSLKPRHQPALFSPASPVPDPPSMTTLGPPLRRLSVNTPRHLLVMSTSHLTPQGQDPPLLVRVS
ncbi:hypothetical protein E2C01_091939 [Portunus trituberculatus]|uniref:Uncharacterized protein n=1 Tax=Portunus trituberculatus TaxID=210409 RepID=A0A5B7JUA0_PORTR|nr:hypothetical protein [Portunus trituberculatus]